MKNVIAGIVKFSTNNSELIGIIASVLVLVSFLMKEIRLIRTISIISCIFFVIYGLLINALSIWLLNGALIFVQIFFLIKLRKNKAKIARLSNQRLKKFTYKTFSQKSLRNPSWFITSDLD